MTSLLRCSIIQNVSIFLFQATIFHLRFGSFTPKVGWFSPTFFAFASGRDVSLTPCSHEFMKNMLVKLGIFPKNWDENPKSV